MFKTPFKISVVLFAIFLFASAIQQGKFNAAVKYLDGFYKVAVRPMLGIEAETGPQPEDTLEAPFREDENFVRQSSLNLPYTPDLEAEKLDVPHRPSEKVAAWLVESMPEVLALDPLKYQEHRVMIAQMLDVGAIQDFEAFLSENEILHVLQGNNMILSSFVEDQPTLMKDGVFEGAYKWVFTVPVMITMIERDAENYTEIDIDDAKRNTRLIVRIQVGRVAEGGVDGMIIERLRFMPNKE